VGVGVAVVTATLAMTPVANAAAVPPNLVPPAGNDLFLTAHVSTGVQIYKCDGKAWTFVAPEADLVDDSGKVIIKHSAGPRWTATDGSRVLGSVKDRANGAPGAIPWLLLSATTEVSGGRLTNTTYIQRINTQDGLAPTDRCNGSTAGTEKRVPYKADYLFYKPTGA
jgi:hypothetical protein